MDSLRRIVGTLSPPVDATPMSFFSASRAARLLRPLQRLQAKLLFVATSSGVGIELSLAVVPLIRVVEIPLFDLASVPTFSSTRSVRRESCSHLNYLKSKQVSKTTKVWSFNSLLKMNWWKRMVAFIYISTSREIVFSSISCRWCTTGIRIWIWD